MIIESKRLGAIEILDDEEIEFVSGLKGFEELKKYILIPMGESSKFFWLQSLEDTEVALSCMNPLEICSDYSPIIDEETLNLIGVADENDILVINTVSIPGDIKHATVNLAAPIIINTANNKAVQVVLQDDKYPVRHNIFKQ